MAEDIKQKTKWSLNTGDLRLGKIKALKQGKQHSKNINKG